MILFRVTFARDTLTDTSVPLLGSIRCVISVLSIIHKRGHCIDFSNNIRIGEYLQNSQRTTMNHYVGVGNDVSLAVKSILQVKKAYLTQMKCHEDLTRQNKSIQHRIRQVEKRNEDLENKLTKLESDKEKEEQMKCHKELTHKNKSLRQKICQLEKTIKDLENKLTKLESDKGKEEQMKRHKELTHKNKSLRQRICQLEKTNKDLENKLTKLESNRQKQEQIVSDLQEQIASDLLRDTNGADVFSDVFVIEQPVCPTSPTNSNKQRSKRKVTPKKNVLPRKSLRLSNRKGKM